MSSPAEKLSALARELRQELEGNILRYWSTRAIDQKNGGFVGRIDGRDQVVENAPKGGILNARILWTFSAAYRCLRRPKYLEMANRAKTYVFDHFFDPERGGSYWSLTPEGEKLDTKNQIYSLAFFIYALVEYYRAAGDKAALDKAVGLFRAIEDHSFDKEKNGYFEAYSRDWRLLDDMRLSDKDANEKKTMNTHLHVLEAYTNLCRVYRTGEVAAQLRNLILVFLERIVDPATSHLNLFFDENWACKSRITSYGHDIEASWLILEAAGVLGEKELVARCEQTCLRIAEAAAEGLQGDGSLIYEKNEATQHTDRDRHWWPQAEAIVGCCNAFELSRDERFLDRAVRCWAYTRDNLVDRQAGEWFWSRKADGSINRTDDKAGFWKCPYHNARACLEIIDRSRTAA